MSRQRVLSLISEVVGSSQRCCPAHSHAGTVTSSNSLKEYAFEMASSNIRYGPGVTQEVGQDAANMNARSVMLVTDKNIRQLPPFQATLDSLTRSRVPFTVFDDVHVEPTEDSFKQAIAFAKQKDFDLFVAIGGGSVIDTAKAANLYSSNPSADFLDYVTPPVGRNLPVNHKVKPLIAIPTTAGTGSETTGVCVFGSKEKKIKVAVASPTIRPTLGLLDPNHVRFMPATVTSYSGFDVFCHALESLTAVRYSDRTPRAKNPKERSGFQGSNPISDVWSRHALEIVNKYFKRAVRNQDDIEARGQMHMASCFAGIGFGNAGVHLPHGMSFPIAGRNKTHNVEEYGSTPIIPHGLAVIVSAPAVFEFTSAAWPERHLEAAELLGADVSNAKKKDAGAILADTIRGYMKDLNIPNGLIDLGFSRDDAPILASSTIAQQRTMKISPRSVAEEDLISIFEKAMEIY